MNERRTQLEEQFEAAEAAVDASKALVRKTSAERLKTLLQRPARDRLQAFGDPFLTPFDQAQLERSIGAQLPRSPIRRDDALAWSTALRRFVRRRRRGLVELVFAIVPIAYFGASAVLATPRRTIPVQFNQELSIYWTLPDGSSLHENVPMGGLGVLVAEKQQSFLRKWFPHAGYGVTGSIPEDLLTKGIITRRP